MALVLQWDRGKAARNISKRCAEYQQTMNKAPTQPDDVEMREEYDFSMGVRGKYAQRYAAGSNVGIPDPGLVELFPNSEAVNEALRLLVRLARQTAHKGTD
jgi:hypothetical protein